MSSLAVKPRRGRAAPIARILDGSAMHRRLRVSPGMCGHNSLFISRVGDWTWDTVDALCGADVFNARNAANAPSYLAFYYLHVMAGRGLHPGNLAFGDEIDVVSRLFDFGSASILALHRISRSQPSDAAVAPFEPEEFYERPRDDCIRIESFNRWVSRPQSQSNENLVVASPPDFAHRHLPELPERYSPRRVYDPARVHHSFAPELAGAPTSADERRMEYRIDVTRDINAVGLVYFAAFFSIVDRAVLDLWRHLGRGDAAFMNRIVMDQKITYLGNVDVDSVLLTRARVWEGAGEAGCDIFNVIVGERDSGRVIAVSTLGIASQRNEDP
jgi:probable biosynthetic protein (TIGR04098 family)